MEFTIKSGSPEKQRSACVVVGVFDNRKPSLSAELIDRASNGYVSEIIRRGDMEGKLGSVLLLHNVRGTLADRVLLVGLGKEREFRDKEFRSAVKAAVKLLNETGSYEAVIYLTEEKVKRPRSRGGSSMRGRRDGTPLSLRGFSRPQTTEVRRPLRKLTLSVPQRSDLWSGEAGRRRGTRDRARWTSRRISAIFPPKSARRPIWRAARDRVGKEFPQHQGHGPGRKESRPGIGSSSRSPAAATSRRVSSSSNTTAA